ncbi:hypothetical protein [Sphingomonas aerolata]|uniref:hypothetical protein n=1 Tax=Sphingomonas aerolata TaxID=185951 RepID=UPI00208EC5E8|nr:hypothetical protein [Sphingomonas aerolata]USR00340.1 hypothetical protein NEF64_00250 [Sphingomonas aerolata]
MARNDPQTGPSPTDAWLGCPSDAAPITVVRASLVMIGGTHHVAILRELRCGDVVLAGGPVWSRSIEDEIEAADVFEGLGLVGDHLVYLAETALVLATSSVDDVVDEHLRNVAAEREKESAKAAEKAAKSEAKALRDRTIAVYFTGSDKKKLGVELRRGPHAPPFLKLTFGAEWERERFWDWLKWQEHRHEEMAIKVEEAGADEVGRELLYEMLTTEQAVKKRGLGAGGRRPLLFWRGDL